MGFETVVKDEKRWWLNRNVIMMLWMMVSVSFCIGFHCHMKEESMKKAEETLASMCEERARMLQEQFVVSVNHVHALAILVSTFHYQKSPPVLDQETFANYTAGTAFERPLLKGVAYAQRVVHAERDLFENQQGWTIMTMKQESSPVQDEYAPVIYSEKTISYVKALDMMSGEEDRENILRARATGKAVLTRPFRLLESNHLGVVLTFPVYFSGLPPHATVEERVKETAGYLGGAFDVESLVENLLRQLAGNHEIMVNVYDVTNASEPLIMYGVHPPHGHMSPSHVSTLDFGDPHREHQMKCRYWKKPPISLTAITTPSGIFVICMLVGYIVYAAKGHYDSVKEDFHKMEELKKKAEAADVAKSQFLATVSHEIRTPMNGVLGMLDMLLNTDLNITQKDCTQTAQVCGKALISLINEVLDRAKIEAGKLELESVLFDLRSTVDDVLSLFSANSRGIEIAAYVSDRVPSILVGDPGRFRQILTNLVGNSVKFTERGHVFVQVHLVERVNMGMMDSKDESLNGQSNNVKVASAKDLFNTLSGLEVAVSTNTWDSVKLLPPIGASLSCTSGSESDSNKVTLMVSVEDTGIGIPIQAQDRVFTPFTQADSSTSRNYGGTGIGLSIGKCLVELMGGNINFVSRPHIGSTFSFTVDLQNCGEGAGSVDRKNSLSEALPARFRGMRAVLVDRRPVRAAVTKYHLRRLGIFIKDVATLNEAQSALSEPNNGYPRSSCSQPRIQPSIVLIEKDSWDPTVKNQLLECGEGHRVQDIVKVVLLSAMESDKTTAASHVDAIIMKPLRASTVASCFRHMLGVEKCQSKDSLLSGSSFPCGLLDGRNILVVDDNKVNLRIAAAKLTKYGAKVECVESGKGALALLRLPHQFDACFMDVQMPEMDGFEATRQIRLMESKAYDEEEEDGAAVRAKRRRLPILAMTADVMPATYEECVKCGMDGYVSKPIDESQLYQAVIQHVIA